MSKARIWHNPRCGTSRKALAALEAAGCDVTVVDYLANPPSADELAGLYRRAGLTPREGLRAKEPLARERGLLEPHTSDAAILAAMAADPILIERPLVETEKGVALCRPAERVDTLL